MSRLRRAALCGAIVLALAGAGCGSDSVRLTGSIRVDGSPAAAPLTRAIARDFTRDHPDVRIAVGTSGAQPGETEIPVANDAIVLIVHPRIPVRCLTTEQLNQIWHRDSEVTERWSEVDDLDPPYGGVMTAWGPGTDTEEFAFFNTAINGRPDSYRDYNNVLHRLDLVIPGVLSTPGNLGYTEYGRYRRNARAVKAIEVDSGDGCVAPTPETIADGSYRPLSRRLSIAAPASAAARPVMEAFLRYYLDHAQEVAPRAGFVPLTETQLDASRARLERLLAQRR